MNPDKNAIDPRVIASLEAALQAPSVHNIQPWKAVVREGSISLTLDEQNQLGPGDPTGRQAVLSLGIFCEAIVVCLRSNGLAASSVTHRHPSVVIKYRSISKKLASNSYTDIRALQSRTTDRSIYARVSVPQETLHSILSAGKEIPAHIWIRTDEKSIHTIAKLTKKGIGLALVSKAFRAELSGLLLQPWSNKKRGIALRSLRIPAIIAFLEPTLLRHGIGLRHEKNLEEKRWNSASGLAFITTDGDSEESWFNAGRKYLRLALAIEQSGLSQATSAATVEASTFHEDIEEMLNTKQRLQAVIRFGKGSAQKKRSPRISIDELLS